MAWLTRRSRARSVGCVEGIGALALEIRIIDGKSVPLVE